MYISANTKYGRMSVTSNLLASLITKYHEISKIDGIVVLNYKKKIDALYIHIINIWGLRYDEGKKKSFCI